MNTQANAVTEARAESQTITSAVIPASRLLFWSVRRELWENRWIYLAPLAVAGLFLLGFLISLIHLTGRMRAAMVLDPMQQYDVIARPYDIAGGLMMITPMIVAAFYCLDALYGERRDRSILFWKSLPVSDVTSVISKLTIPVLVLPLLGFAMTIATEYLMLVLSSAIFAGSGVSIAGL